ncbi:MAG: class I SAM-dependent methyltransferase, partial [Chloroflexi bacterium]|nr:class I SAM-dependent methyltransferase [Chloroflexota bacterium]
MSRLRNVAQAGFVATPPAHFRRIAAQVAPGDGASWLLDPCAGRGAVGRALAHRWHLQVAMVEINQERGRWVRRRADHAVIADALATECGHGQFVAVMSNPPYDRDDQHTRLEWRFLQRFRDALCPEGLLVYIIPGYRMLQDSAIIPHLAQFYHDLRLFTLPAPNPYQQVILYARRRASRDTQSRAAVDWLKTTLQCGPPLLPDVCADPYILPARPRDRVHLRGQELDVEQVRLDGLASGLTLDDLFQGPAELNTRVVMPLKKGHLASIMAAGLLDNARVGDDVIRGSVRQDEVEEPVEDEAVTITRTVYYPRIVAFNPRTGEFRILEESTELGAYMAEHAAELARRAQAKFQPRYEFDLGALPERVQWLIAHLSPGAPVPGKPPGLWPGQKHVLAALYTAATQGVRTLFLEAQMGYGKSRVGAGFIALFHLDDSRKPGWFVTEAHLVDQMVGEVKATVPTALVVKIECLEDAVRFVQLGQHPDYSDRLRIAVIGKQTLKDGSGWAPAVVRRRLRVPMTLDEAAEVLSAGELAALQAEVAEGVAVFPRQTVTAYQCPDCGRWQVYGTGDNQGQVIVDDDEYFAKTLRRCLYDVVQEERGLVRQGCGAFLGQVSRCIGGTAGRGQEGGFGRVASPAVRYARNAAGHRVPLAPVRRREPVPGQPGEWQV